MIFNLPALPDGHLARINSDSRQWILQLKLPKEFTDTGKPVSWVSERFYKNLAVAAEDYIDLAIRLTDATTPEEAKKAVTAIVDAVRPCIPTIGIEITLINGDKKVL